DASRISPPVLLPGFPNPVRLAIGISVHGSGLPVRDLRSSLHAAVTPQADGAERVVVEPGERLNRDFILRFRLGSNAISTALSVHPDPGTDGSAGGTFALTIVPPSGIETNTRPRDVVFVIDRSGSMEGWKMVAARRALARMVDALNDHDRFTLLAFDTTVETPRGFDGASLCAATDRNRFRAVEYLAQLEARGGTEMADPLDKAAKLLSSRAGERDRVLVFVTDGQVGNEDQLLRLLGKRLSGIRFFALGVDTAVNEAFLRRLVALGEGSCECVESEDRLDEVMTSMHRRIDAPLLNGLKIEAAGLQALQDTIVPSRMSDLFAGAPLLVMGRYQGQPAGAVSVQATDAQGRPWSETVQAVVRENPAIVSVWARGRIRELEDLYVVSRTNRESLERQVTTTSLAYGILCRFTAYVAVDTQQVVNEGGEVHQIVQPVEVPQGWEDRSLTRSTWAPVMHAARASHGFARGAMAYSAPESSDSVDSVCDRAMPTGIWASLSAMDGPPPPTRSAKGAAGSRGEDSLPHASRRMRSMNWRRIKAALGWGSAASGALPDGLNLPECRRFADAVLEHLIDVLSNQGRGRLKALRALAKQLLELSQRLKVVGAPEAEVQAFVELHAELEALPKRKVPPPAQAAALCAKVEGIRQALLAQAGPSSGTTGERGQSFWK
ncbi:MAG TPA: VWA domain-containing protein, partial [Isosphaeraceae bacterium]|nr:VWA domain-containing protein [Isosphaeraceae bacterium]